MSPQNLTNVYNQNPTLQGQYSLQQYLDLFGESTYTPPTTGNTTTTPIQSSQGIINQNINQYQGGGGGGGIGDLTLNRVASPRTANFNINPFSNRTVTGKEDMSGMAAPIGGDKYYEEPGMLTRARDKIGNFTSGITSAYRDFKESPMGSAIGTAMSFTNPVSALANVAGMMGRKDLSELDVAFNKSGDTYTSAGGIGNKDKYGINKVSLRGNYADYVDKTADKTAEAYAAAVEKYKDTKYNYMSQKLKDARVKELKERMEYYAAAEKRKIDAENKARDREQQALNNAYAAQSQAKRDQIDRSTGGQFDGASSKQEYNSNPTGFSGSSRDGGLMGYGGRSGTPRYQQYFNGGIVSLRRR